LVSLPGPVPKVVKLTICVLYRRTRNVFKPENSALDGEESYGLGQKKSQLKLFHEDCQNETYISDTLT